MKNKLINILNNKIFIFILIYIFFLFISFYIPYIADDYSFAFSSMNGERISSIADIIQSVIYDYFHWNGRLICYFFTDLFMLRSIGRVLFIIFYPIVNILVIELIHRIVNKESNYNYYYIFAIIISAHILVLNQTMFWISGWCTYVISLIPLLYVLYCFIMIIKYINVNWYALYAACIFGSLFVEHYSIIIFSLALIALIFLIIKHKCNINVFLFFISSAIGLSIILFAPGLANRASQDLTTVISFDQKVLFGWCRFIYCYFYMNQRIFLLFSLVLLITLIIKQKYLYIIPVIPTIVFSSIMLFRPELLNPYMFEALSGEWSYYTCEPKTILLYSPIVIYYSIIPYISCVVLQKSKFETFIIYSAAICSSLCFITTNLACERTQFISYIFIAILACRLMEEFEINKIKLVTLIFSLSLILYSSVKLIKNYQKEYNIFLENKERIENGINSGTDTIVIKEHNYDYIFKSDLDFNQQNNWLMKAYKKYYGIDEDVKIMNEVKE